MNMLRLRVGVGILLAFISSAALPKTYAPAQIVSVLVDLSETWHNRSMSGYNSQLLRKVGAAIADSAQRMPKPVAVRHYSIGTASLAKPPLCNIMYRPSLIGFGSAEDGVEANFRKFSQYLTGNCPGYVLRQPAEPSTEITAAIVTALQTDAMARKDVPRVMVILSDFKEETGTRYKLARGSLKGVRVILLWRTLPEDRRQQSLLTSRIRYWKRFVTDRDGEVAAFADTAVATSPAELRSFIEGGS